MAKSFLSSFINSIAKSADKAIASGKKSNNKKQVFVKKGTESRLPDSDKYENVYFNSSSGNISGNLKFKINGSDYMQPFSGNYKEKKSNDKWSNISDHLTQKTAELKKQNQEWARLFSELNELYSSALALEKVDAKSAIHAHYKVVSFAENTPRLNRYNHYARSVRRLTILYRKDKDYESEIALIKQYSRRDSKLSVRLAKAKELLSKSK